MANQPTCTCDSYSAVARGHYPDCPLANQVTMPTDEEARNLESELRLTRAEERQRAVEICDLLLERLIDREKCARAIRDPQTKCPTLLRQSAELRRAANEAEKETKK